MTRNVQGLFVLMLAIAFGWAAPARADQWNDKTVLTFSAPVMIPGKTLPAGTYVFKLADPGGAHQAVTVYTQDQQRVLATLQTVPTKRLDVTGDIVVTFDATERGVAPALKAWFAPGSQYGYEFIYPKEQAKEIARRSKTLVLSNDVGNSDAKQGTLHVIDAAGVSDVFRADPAMMNEWEQWQRSRSRDASAADRSSASTIAADFRGQRVKLDDLEDHPANFIGRQISVDGEIDDVLGPTMFTLDEPNWLDLKGEILVVMPANVAAMVRENDRVTVSGTLRPFVKSDVEHEWGWFDLDPDVEAEFSRKPVLVADRIVGGDEQTAMMITVSPAGERAVGTSGAGAAAASPITDAATIAQGEQSLVGRTVDLNAAKVLADPAGRGFYISGGNRQIFVLPASAKDDSKAHPGQSLAIHGVILQSPHMLKHESSSAVPANADIYVYATKVDAGTSGS
jgi:hypothetical protein